MDKKTEEYIQGHKVALELIQRYQRTFRGKDGEGVIVDLIDRFILHPEKVNPDEVNVVKFILAMVGFNAADLLTHIERMIEYGSTE